MKKIILTIGSISFAALPALTTLSCSNESDTHVLTLRIDALDDSKDTTFTYTYNDGINMDELLLEHPSDITLSDEDSQFGRYVISANGVTPDWETTHSYWQLVQNGTSLETGVSFITLDTDATYALVETPSGEVQDYNTSLSKQFDIQDDGMYLIKNEYDGTFWDGNKTTGSEHVGDFRNIPFTPSTSNYNDDVVEIGDGDSIYVLYDQDDNDGMNIYNFENTVFFDDTSVMDTPAISGFNQAVGNRKITNGYGINLTTFNVAGYINTWFGSQSNHVEGRTFDESLAEIQKYYEDQPEIYQAINEYYQTASHSFYPVFQETPYFTFTKLNYAVKIDVHFTGGAPITGAKFVMTHDQSSYQYSSPFSIGDQSEWDRYENSRSNQRYTFAARKNVFLG